MKVFKIYDDSEERYYSDVEERIYSTGDETLDELLERAFCDGYDCFQKEFAIANLAKAAVPAKAEKIRYIPGIKVQRAIQRNPLNGRRLHELHGINDSINAKQLIQTNEEGQAITKFLGGKQQMNKAIMRQAHGGY